MLSCTELAVPENTNNKEPLSVHVLYVQQTPGISTPAQVFELWLIPGTWIWPWVSLSSFCRHCKCMGWLGLVKRGGSRKGWQCWALDWVLVPHCFALLSWDSAWLQEPYKWKKDGKTKFKKTWERLSVECHCPVVWSPNPSLYTSSRNC